MPPYPEQESEELDIEVVTRLNPDTGEIENLEVLFFSTRASRLVYNSAQSRFTFNRVNLSLNGGIIEKSN